MSGFARRDFLSGAALLAYPATASFTPSQEAERVYPRFMNNVPAPVLAGKDLPTFKFAL